MNKINYQKELERVIADNQQLGRVPGLLLHVCCAPCSSYCLEYLSHYFDITVYYYNPNITIPEEYAYRLREEKRLLAQMDFARPVRITESEYHPADFLSAVRGLEREPEGGRRCRECFRLRLEATAKKAAAEGYDYFTTTLTISPLKNAALLNELGAEMGAKHGAAWLYSDFKKKEGYKRSIELSRAYDLYRQNYCGCIFSKAEQQAKSADKEQS